MIIIAEVSELTRKIKLSTDRVISVNGDYQVDGIAFKLPATYEGDFDFSTAAVRVHWTGVDKVEHTNLITEEDGNGYPLWIMPSELTQGGHGVIEFAVSFIATDETAAVTKRWISDPVSFRNRRTVNGSSEDEAEEEAIYDRLASAIAAVRAAQASVDKVNEVLAGITNSSPVVVATAADLSDLDVTKHQLAIVRADGYLYYYDGAAWQQGIKYGSYELDTTLTESGKAADAAAVGAEVSAIKEDLSAINGVSTLPETTKGYGYNTTGSTIDINAPTAVSSVECVYSVCKAGDFYIYTGKGSSSYRNYAILDSNGTILVKSEAIYVENEIIFCPENSAYIVFNNLRNNYTLKVTKGIPINSRVDKALLGLSFAGKKFSLLGDSISAYEGYSVSGHNYYPSSASDISSVDEMWWKILGNSLNMFPLTINAWSGSTVGTGLRDATQYVPASDTSRCENLSVNGINPDVVIIAMGVNDYSYAKTGSLGDWDGTTPLGSSSDLSDYDVSTFRTAYATMLARIQHKYPDAFIVCITPFYQSRYSTDTGATYLNANGNSISDYADAVRDICGIMHVACVNGTNIGFNRYNYYPKYAMDSATKPTHPTIAGQRVIADAVTASLKSLVCI